VAVEQERVTSEGRFPPWVRHEHLARYLFAAERSDGKIVVDCACGVGVCARIVGAQAAEVHGFDVSEAAVTAAQALRNGDNGGNVSFATADATELPLPGGTADLYVSLETIEHLSDHVSFLNEVVRVLKPSGMFICSTPDRDVYSPGSTSSSRPWNRFHVREYSEPEFLSLLGSYFEHVDLYGQNPKVPELVRLRCAVGRHAPSHLVVRLNQAFKLPRYVYDRLEHHLVQPATPGRRYEYLVAVCEGPRRRSSGHGA
jgi:SAM-dependent methyltransferase